MADATAGFEVLEESEAPRPTPRVWLQGAADPEAVGAALTRAFGPHGVVFGHGAVPPQADVVLISPGPGADVRALVEAAAEEGQRVVVIGSSEDQHAPAIRAGARGFVLGPSPSPVRLASAILGAFAKRSLLDVPSDNRFRRIADESTDMVSIHDPDGVYTYVSPSCRRLLGYDPEDLLGRSAYDFFHPDDLDAIRASHDHILRRPTVYVVRYRIRRKDGTHTWFETTSKTIRDPRGGIVEIFAHSRDISDRLEKEQRREREVVGRAAEERERAIAAYRRSLLNAAGHGLRTPLTPIRLQLASLKQAALPESHARSVDLVARNVERLSQAIEGFLELARIHTDAATFEVVPMDLAAIAASVATEADVESIADGPITVEADARHIMRVLAELIDNAKTAAGPEGRVKVRVERAGEEAHCTVEDDGIGFGPDEAESLFEPFHTGDRPGRGLGLAIVRAILGRQGGHIIAHSDGEGQGARFTFALPVARSPAARAAEAMAGREGGHEAGPGARESGGAREPDAGR